MIPSHPVRVMFFQLHAFMARLSLLQRISEHLRLTVMAVSIKSGFHSHTGSAESRSATKYIDAGQAEISRTGDIERVEFY